MESIKAISLMVLWTVLSLYALYYLGAFENFRNPLYVTSASNCASTLGSIIHLHQSKATVESFYSDVHNHHVLPLHK